MASPAGIIGKFFGNAVSEAAAFAAGVALGPVLGPPTQALRNTVNAAYPFVPLDAEIAAAVVAEDVDQLPWGEGEALNTGVNSGRFQRLVGETLNAPGVGELFALWRRGLIGDGDFTHGLRKAKLETRWDGPLEGLHDTLLSSEELAMMQQQGFVTQGRADSEGALQGVTAERQQLRFEASGLPPGIGEALQMLRRGIIGEAEFAQIVREGHTKTKYTDELLALRSQVLSAAEYAGLFLRGWITQAERDAGGALTGYSPAQMQLMFENRGRPATPRQIHLGYARGATHAGGNLTEAEAIALGVKQSDIRPEWLPIEAATVWTYPSPFVLRALAADGTFTEAQTRQILIEEGWKPQYATLAAAKWSSGVTAKGKGETASELSEEYAGGFLTEAEYRAALTGLGYTGAALELEVHHADAALVKAWRDRVVTALHKLFVAHTLDEQKARDDLAGLGVSPEAVARLMPLWTLERDATRKELTAAQVKAAYRKSVIDQPTALAELERRGYTAADAAEYLAS